LGKRRKSQSRQLNRRQARWALYLLRFNFILKHIPESKMGKVNSLSRRLGWEVGVEKNNEDKMLVKPEWLEVRKTKKVEVIVEEVDLLEKVKQSKVKYDEVIKAVKVSQLYCGPVVTYCMVYYYTKRAILARLLANEGPAIYVVL